MRSSILALVVAAGLSGQVLAQQGTLSDVDHNAHHPQPAKEQVAAPTGSTQAQTGNMPNPQAPMPGTQGGTMDQGGQRPAGMMSGMGMMNCPMMQGMAAMSMGQPRGDQSVASLALHAVNQRMHRDMAMEYTGNVDADFARSMIAHHRGAIDMAKIAVAFGKDPKIRELAQNVIKAQEDEITTIRSWLAQNARQ
jgi:uncharacterized protein (DUF305 family)